MSDIRLFRLTKGRAVELRGQALDLERTIQHLIEENLEEFLGVRFLISEFATGRTHAGRIDTLGIDENNCPVIIEYKRSVGESVINQGLFYLDWLMDHQAEFTLLVMHAHGKAAAQAIDWSAPRLLCIAADFTRYDAHAVQQIDRNVELVRYRRFGDNLILFELVNAVGAKASSGGRSKGRPRKGGGTARKGTSTDKPVADWLRDLTPAMKDLFDSSEGYITSLGDDVQRKDLRLYIAFKRLRNFATVVFQKQRLVMNLHLDPSKIALEEGFSRDVRKIGHWGTGSLELSIKSAADLEKAKPLIRRAYEGGPDAR